MQYKDGTNINFEVLNKYSDNDGRLLLLNVRIEDMIVSLVCLYAPNYKKITQYI